MRRALPFLHLETHWSGRKAGQLCSEGGTFDGGCGRTAQVSNYLGTPR